MTNPTVSAEELERLSHRLAMVEQGMLTRLLRLEARLELLEKRTGQWQPAWDLAAEDCRRQIEEIMRRPEQGEET